MKRIEFKENDNADPFVVFEGHEDEPFWHRTMLGPCFVFTNMTLATANKFAEQGVVKRTEFESNEAEFDEYRQQAIRTHRKIL